MLENAARHKKSKRDSILQKARAIARGSPSELYGNQTRLSKEVHSRSTQVGQEIHRLYAFMRFESFPEMLLFSQAESEHEVMDRVLSLFTWRYPTFVVCIYSEGCLYCGSRRKDVSLPKKKLFRSKGEALEWVRGELSSLQERNEFLDWDESYWREYFKSAYVKSRVNKRQYRKFMRKKDVKRLGLFFEECVTKSE